MKRKEIKRGECIKCLMDNEGRKQETDDSNIDKDIMDKRAV